MSYAKTWICAASLVLVSACADDAATMKFVFDAGEPERDAGPLQDAEIVADGSIPEVTCMTLKCGRDQHCMAGFPKATCQPNQCDDLDCAADEVCVTTTAGAHCEDDSCGSDLNCPVSDHCKELRCVPDVCEARATQCMGEQLFACSANGSTETKQFECGGDNAYFDSRCVQASAVQAGCSCEDDWDCSEGTACDAGLCRGTGNAPACTVVPASLIAVAPAPELTWGGLTAGDAEARVASLDAVSPPVAGGRAKVIWPEYAQVTGLPLVINLDDDNDDGAIDERDYPEIVFVTYSSSPSEHGVLRAIHGGGPHKGKDFFASCGTTTWHEGEPTTATCSAPDLDPSAPIAAGDLDGDGRPELVALRDDHSVRLYDARGRRITESAALPTGGDDPGITIANVDGAGFAELVIGRHVLTLAENAGKLAFADRFSGAGDDGTSGNQGPVTCVANLVGSSRPELVAGTVAYRMPRPPAGATHPSDCTANGGTITPATAEQVDFCSSALTIVWDGATLNSLVGDAARGLCAVADVLGKNQALPPGPGNALDGKPEVINVVGEDLRIFNGQTGELVRTIDLGAGSAGGAPSVGDFDGDGFPELAVALGNRFVVSDLQAATSNGACDAWPVAQTDDGLSVAAANVARTPPAQSCSKDSDCGDTGKLACNETSGRCICLHNGWSRVIENENGAANGASVFDFDGDGAAELASNDECNVRIYDGANGAVLFKEASESRTRLEYPVIADVDNDGNAELVFGASNDSGACSEAKAAQYNDGLEVWGSPNDAWASARRIWNQHAYHFTNVTESGAIPLIEPESWKSYQGRSYDAYRGMPGAQGRAANLVPTAVQISGTDTCAALGKSMTITVQIENAGELRAGPGVTVAFFGTFGTSERALGDGKGGQLSATITQSLEPGEVAVVSATYDATKDKSKLLPNGVRVAIDDDKRERECVEDDNGFVAAVVADTRRPDLQLELKKTAGCPLPDVTFEVCNRGKQAADGVRVRFFAGKPSEGGLVLGDATLEGALAPDKCVTKTETLAAFPSGRAVRVYGVVDPLDEIAECSDHDNTAAAPEPRACQ